MPVCANCNFQYPDSAGYCSSCGSSREGPVRYSHRNSAVFAVALLACISIWELGASTPNQDAAQPRPEAVVAAPPVNPSRDHSSTRRLRHGVRNGLQQSKSASAADRASRAPSGTRRLSANSASTGISPTESTEPNVASQASPAQSVPATTIITPKKSPGMLGISGANWIENGFKGVQITDVRPESPAEMVGLHPHDVITDINGQRIQTTEDLAAVLSQYPGGGEITLGYVFKSNLGWMPKTVVITLGNM
jgi:membrane-associated protease RseP (regulator of RpoE activity)